MHSKWVFKHFRPKTSMRNFRLILIWGIGLILGVLLCDTAPYNCTEMLYETISVKPSLLSLFLICVLPVSLSAIAVCLPFFPIAYLLLFLCSVTHGFCGTVVNLTFGSSAWIIRPLILFSSGCTTVLVFWILFQSHTGRCIKKNICLALTLSFLVCILDLFLVSPFLGDLINIL